MAKYLAAEAGFFAADRAVQTHGGFGYATEYHVERYFREARLQRIAPISQEMILTYIAEHVLGLPGRTDVDLTSAARARRRVERGTRSAAAARFGQHALPELDGEAEALDVDALVVAVEAAAELGGVDARAEQPGAVGDRAELAEHAGVGEADGELRRQRGAGERHATPPAAARPTAACRCG